MVKVLKFGLKFWALKVGAWLGAVGWGKVLKLVVRCVRSVIMVCEVCCRSRSLAVVKFVVCELRNEVGI